MEPHRWVGTGRIVFNNKGNPVKQYEPYFSITHQFEDDLQIVQIGVSPEIFYDALGRNIKTVMPDGTFTKVVYHPWHQELWDAGDTVIDSAWYSTRQALGIVDPYHPDYIASEKSKAYANTPQLIYFDNLGRPVCNQEHIFNDPDDIDDVFVYTQLKLDIEGNLMNVIDGLDRECMAFKYNMLGQRLYQTHIDSGERWNMTNAMGKPLWQLNSKGTIFTFTYDVLNRPLDFIADDGVSSITYQKMQYGEGEINAHLHNLNGKLLDLRDGSGEQGFKEYDFKGNALYVSKGFVEVVGNLPDWSSAVDMASGGLNSITLYDALNRPITIDAGDKTTKYTYNEAGLPETVIVDDGSDNLIVENISYNAKGQREFIGFGNDTYSEYFYDEKTFRLKRIITQRDADTEPLQDINYVYDAVGNIVYVKDNAQQTFYFDNSIINPESFYTYDALYRLIEATGRENFNNTGFYEVTTPQGLGGNDVQNYERSFEYDVVGNITKMQHAASANSFTKHFHYDNDNNQLTRIFIGSSVSPLESYTYDEHGNMLESNDRQFTYNLLDQLQVVDITGGSWKAIYMYNAEGQRDRKIILNSAGTKDRANFQNYELYREFDNADDLVLERFTNHITDGEKKVVQWDTPSTLPSGSGEVETIRYQYSNNLQSVGLELDQNADIISYEEYYPFGGNSYSAPENDIDVPRKRYKYCGKEQDEETGLYYYGARYYAPWLCRFTSVDPKALEYVHQSTYVFADNNPVVKYDVNGEGVMAEGTDADVQPQATQLPIECSSSEFKSPEKQNETKLLNVYLISEIRDGIAVYNHDQLKLVANEATRIDKEQGVDFVNYIPVTIEEYKEMEFNPATDLIYEIDSKELDTKYRRLGSTYVKQNFSGESEIPSAVDKNPDQFTIGGKIRVRTINNYIFDSKDNAAISILNVNAIARTIRHEAFTHGFPAIASQLVGADQSIFDLANKGGVTTESGILPLEKTPPIVKYYLKILTKVNSNDKKRFIPK